MKLGEIVVHMELHQVLSKSDEKQKRFINSLFFCSEFQSVSRIVKIVHSETVQYCRAKMDFFPVLAHCAYICCKKKRVQNATELHT